MASRKIEQELEALNELRQESSPSVVESALRKSLRNRVNVVVAKAASLAGEFGMRSLTADLCAAFERMLVNPVEADRQCWAKNAIVKALTQFGYAESAIFLQGSNHVQMEAVWGGEQDTAVTLRGTCILGLVQTTDLPRRQILRQLVRGLTDSQPGTDTHPVRLEAVRALEQMGGEEAPLLLRLKARLGDATPAVTGQVFDALLRLEPGEALPFVSEFLRTGKSEAREEAALSIGTSRSGAAVRLLIEEWKLACDGGLRSALLNGLSASRQDDALEFLLNIVAAEREHDALAALAALEVHRDDGELRERIARSVKGRSETSIAGAFRARFPRPDKPD